MGTVETPPPPVEEKAPAFSRRAKIVIGLIGALVFLGFAIQTNWFMGTPKTEKKADPEPVVVGQPVDYASAQAKADRQREADEAVKAANKAKEEKNNRNSMMGSLANRTVNPAGPTTPGAADKLNLDQVKAEFAAKEALRVLEAGRAGFGPSAQLTKTAGYLPTKPDAGNPEVARVQQQIEATQMSANKAREDAARLIEVAQKQNPELTQQMLGEKFSPNSPSLPKQQDSMTFGESAQNRAVRDPGNVGPKPGEVLLPTASVLSAVLQQEIISDYEGNWLAVLQRPVYDVSGDSILFPIGTKATGKNIPVNKVNEVIQNRVGLTVTWMIRPDGKRIDFRRTAALDVAGVAAIQDEVDRHFMAQFFGVLAYAVVGLGPSTQSYGTEPNSSPDAAVREVTAQSRAIGRNIATKYLSIVPTITIRAGTPIKIFTEDDIYVQPWAKVDSRFFARQ